MDRIRGLGRAVARYGCLVPLLIILLWIAPKAGLLLVGAPVIAYLVSRLLTLQAVQAFMLREGQSARLAPFLDEAIPGPPPDSELRFQEIDESADIALTPEQNGHLRQAVETGPETWRIFRRSLAALGVALLCLFLGWTLYVLVGTPSREGWPVLLFWGLLALPLLPFYWITRQRFLSMQRVPVVSSLVAYLALAVISGALIAQGGVLPPGAYLFLLAIAAGIWVLLHGHWTLIRRLQEPGNHPLLILRVFGADANTAFVFGEIMHRWCFLGDFATIADPSYVRFESSLALRENRRWLGIATVSYILLLTIAGFMVEYALEFLTSFQLAAAVNMGLDIHGPFELTILATGVVLVFASAVFASVRTRRKFSYTFGRVREGSVMPAQNVIYRGTFGGHVLYCYNDTWKPAVASLLSSVHVVLMDVRGFTPERRGCEYELGLLIQKFPIDQAVLLIDDGPHKAALFAILQDQWSRMSADSPNRKLRDPILKTYAPGEEDPEDITRILALLVGSLPGNAGASSSASDAEASLIRGVTAGSTKRAVGLERLGELDLAMPRSAVAKIAIPLILTGIVAYSWYRVQPVIDAYRSLPLSASLCRIPAAVPSGEAGPWQEPIAPSSPLLANASVVTGPAKPGAMLCIHFSGGLVASAYRIEPFGGLTVLGNDRQPLEVAPAVLSSGGQRLCYELHLPAGLDRIRRIEGQMVLHFVRPEQKIVVKDLAAMLPGHGWCRLSDPRLGEKIRFDLIRFGPGDGLQILAKGDLKDVQLLLVRPDGADVGFGGAKFGTSYLRREVGLQDLQAGAWGEIVLGADRSQTLAFQVADIPVGGR